jgi:methylenetetrahydrofolate dehydrogenase (NADP+)/methenyltetrahydrofolate cyclohydrolase
MVAQIINGKEIALAARGKITEDILNRLEMGKDRPGLAVILVGEDPASLVYVKNKRQACKEVGILSYFHPLASDVSEAALISLIQQLNTDKQVHGILLQLPLPAHCDSRKIIEMIDPQKDVDGFHPYNLGRLLQGAPLLRPCTPQGVMDLLAEIKFDCKNKNAVVVGASNIVGKPMYAELLLAGHLSEHVNSADVLVSAVGSPLLIKGNWIKPGAVVVDIGITRLADGRLAGDVDFESAKQHAAWITPVPGGVGPMTVAALLKNTLLAFDLQQR